jgi:hypothetical protein
VTELSRKEPKISKAVIRAKIGVDRSEDIKVDRIINDNVSISRS